MKISVKPDSFKKEWRMHSIGIALRNDVHYRFTNPDAPAVWIYPCGLPDAIGKVVHTLIFSPKLFSFEGIGLRPFCVSHNYTLPSGK